MSTLRGIAIGALFLVVTACDTPARPDATPIPATSLRPSSIQIASLSVTDVSSESATISWTTNVPTDGLLSLYRSASDASPSNTVRQTSLSISHTMYLHDLASGFQYFFSVRSGTATEAISSELNSFTTLAIPTGPTSSNLIATAVSVIEFDGGGRWYYAPLITVRETTGSATATVIKIDFQIPGLGRAPAIQTSKCIMPAEERSLLNETYGDYEMTIHGSGRSTGGTATGSITYLDGAGHQSVLSVSAPITSGPPFPGSYSGSQKWSCAAK